MKLTRAVPPPPPQADFVLTLTPDEKAKLTKLVGEANGSVFGTELYNMLIWSH